MRVDVDQRAINNLDLLPELHEAMHWHARRIVVYAKRIAPVWSGTYRRSISAARVPSSRALAIVGSSDPKAMILEYGSKHNRAFHTLSQACRRAGYVTYEVVR